MGPEIVDRTVRIGSDVEAPVMAASEYGRRHSTRRLRLRDRDKRSERDHRQRSRPTVNGSGLTERECEIISWVARGKSNAEIASILWLSPLTVRKHLENIYPKLGVHRRTEAAVRAIRLGLVRAD
jgi:DNA-binding CsgD family transcriptional regulator